MRYSGYVSFVLLTSLLVACSPPVPDRSASLGNGTTPSPDAQGWTATTDTPTVDSPAADVTPPAGTTFEDDLAFLKEHTEIVVLSDSAGKAQVAVAPAYQGRVMTSTADGGPGLSFGWINRELIASGEVKQHINVFGGEDRFWIGPEGGQFSIFFANDVPFDLEHWFTPAPIDTQPFQLVDQQAQQAVFQQDIQLTNYSETVFDVRVDREVRLLTHDEAVKALGMAPAADVRLVAFESINKMTNSGQQPWEQDSGLLSIWILGMLTPSPSTTVVMPYIEGPEEDLGPIVNDAYFGKVPSDRLKADEGKIYFCGDGQYRSKIGLSPERSKPVMGSYDAANRVLTIVQYNKPDGVTDYVNSMWELQKQPYRGDVVNSYNDGPAEPGAKPLGPFYELESSSPAAALGPGETVTHVHRTIHLQGSAESLSLIADEVLGATVETIEQALSP